MFNLDIRKIMKYQQESSKRLVKGNKLLMTKGDWNQYIGDIIYTLTPASVQNPPYDIFEIKNCKKMENDYLYEL